MDQKPPHKSVRLPFVAYTEPYLYFVTICTTNREQLFGEIQSGQMVLNDLGRIVDEEWRRSGEVRAELILDQFIVMPDHLHGLVGLRPAGDLLDERDRAHSRAALQAEPLRGSRDRAPRSLCSFIAQFKATTTRRINDLRRTAAARVWQPRFYEHIIRQYESVDKARQYILKNPERWAADQHKTGVLM
ncbi:MAG TPA: transposase [bacterium]|jgi:REP element-mobilizing transposase RayT